MPQLKTDHSATEARLRGTCAPVIEFLERAKHLDDGYPDRYRGDRHGKFNPDDFALDFAFTNPMDRTGFTLDSRIEFSPYDEHGHGPALDIGVWVRDHSYHGNDASMSIRVHGDGTVLYQGACHNLDNPPSRMTTPLVKDKYESYGIYRMLSTIVETYYYYSFEANRTAALNKLAADVHQKYYGDPQMKTVHAVPLQIPRQS